MKLGSWRTCPYPWLGLGWTELLAVELASVGGERGSPKWLKTTARGGSEGSAASRPHEQTPNAPPEQLLELEGHRRSVALLWRSPEFSGRGSRPEAYPTGLWPFYVYVEVVRSGAWLEIEKGAL